MNRTKSMVDPKKTNVAEFLKKISRNKTANKKRRKDYSKDNPLICMDKTNEPSSISFRLQLLSQNNSQENLHS